MWPISRLQNWCCLSSRIEQEPWIDTAHILWPANKRRQQQFFFLFFYFLLPEERWKLRISFWTESAIFEGLGYPDQIFSGARQPRSDRDGPHGMAWRYKVNRRNKNGPPILDSRDTLSSSVGLLSEFAWQRRPPIFPRHSKASIAFGFIQSQFRITNAFKLRPMRSIKSTAPAAR